MHEIGQEVKKYLKKNAGNAAFILGMILTVGSLVDHINNEDLNRYSEQLFQIRDELSEKYSVRLSCTSTGGSWGPTVICAGVVDGDYTQEERQRVLAEYRREMIARSKMVLTPTADVYARSLRDSLGIFIGSTIGFFGALSILERRKEVTIYERRNK